MQQNLIEHIPLLIAYEAMSGKNQTDSEVISKIVKGFQNAFFNQKLYKSFINSKSLKWVRDSNLRKAIQDLADDKMFPDISYKINEFVFTSETAEVSEYSETEVSEVLEYSETEVSEVLEYSETEVSEVLEYIASETLKFINQENAQQDSISSDESNLPEGLNQYVLNYMLFLAVQNEKLEDVKYLLERGANANANVKRYNKGGIITFLTALELASECGYSEILKAILDENLPIQPSLEDKNAALILAIATKHLENVRILLEAGAEVNSLVIGFPPLTRSISIGYDDHYAVIKTLLDAGADIHQVNQNGETVLEYAKTEGAFKFLFFVGIYEVISMSKSPISGNEEEIIVNFLNKYVPDTNNPEFLGEGFYESNFFERRKAEYFRKNNLELEQYDAITNYEVLKFIAEQNLELIQRLSQKAEQEIASNPSPWSPPYDSNGRLPSANPTSPSSSTEKISDQTPEQTGR